LKVKRSFDLVLGDQKWLSFRPELTRGHDLTSVLIDGFGPTWVVALWQITGAQNLPTRYCVEWNTITAGLITST
jgi:hypothetical protein